MRLPNDYGFTGIHLFNGLPFSHSKGDSQSTGAIRTQARRGENETVGPLHATDGEGIVLPTTNSIHSTYSAFPLCATDNLYQLTLGTSAQHIPTIPTNFPKKPGQFDIDSQ